MRKHNAIDLMKLYSLGSANGWNNELTDCYAKLDINRLAKLKYQIQAGMDDLVKDHLNSNDINLWFIRLCRSIDITAKRIIKVKHPFPQDSGLILKGPECVSMVEQKKKRDQDLARFLATSSY